MKYDTKRFRVFIQKPCVMQFDFQQGSGKKKKKHIIKNDTK